MKPVSNHSEVRKFNSGATSGFQLQASI